MDKQHNSDNNKPNIAMLGAGNLFAGMILVSFGLGYAIDVWLDTSPLGMLLLGLFGLIGGIVRIYKLLT